MAYSDYTAGEKLTAAKLNERLGGWVQINASVPSINGQYNVSDITDNGTGDFTVTWDTDFVNSFKQTVIAGSNEAGRHALVNGTPLAGSADIRTYTAGDVLVDVTRMYILAFGSRT